jgi:two-component system, NarL family, sensor histidine kinase UhpB
VVSGAIGEEAAVDAMLAGANDFIMKDNMARLPAAIRRAVSSADARRRLHRAEAALRESEGLLRSLADNLPAMVLRVEYDRTDHSFQLAYVGGAATQLLGVRPQEIRAQPDLLLTALVAEDREAFISRLRTAADAGTGLSWEGRCVVGGAERWIQVEGRLRERTAAHALFDTVAFDISGLKRAESEVRELTAHLESVKERERAGVAREIHDDIGALFFGLKVDLAWLRKRVTGKAALLKRLESIEAQLDSGIEASHRIVRSLRPAVLDYGVVGAAEWLARDFGQRTGVACDFKSNAEDVELAPEAGTAIFRVLQESLTNIVRHAKASRVTIELHKDDHEIMLLVNDNGRGIGATELGKRNSFGVRGMRERARELGGAFELGPAQGGGTQLSLRLPLERK